MACTYPSIVGRMLGHVAFEFAPLQLAPALVAGGHVRCARARCARGAPVPALAAVVLVRRPRADGGDARSRRSRTCPTSCSSRTWSSTCCSPTSARCCSSSASPARCWQPLLRAPAAGCASSATRSSRSRCWAANFYLWHLPALYQGAVEHDAVHALQHILFVSFGIAMWMALLGPLPKPAWFGNGCEDRLHRRRPADRERAGQRAAVVERGPLSALRGRRAPSGASRPPTIRARRARS